MKVSFSAQEKRHVLTLMSDLLEHLEIRPDKNLNKQVKRYKNKFLGANADVNLKKKEMEELGSLVISSVDMLTNLQSVESFPKNKMKDLVAYLEIAEGLAKKLVGFEREVNEQK